MKKESKARGERNPGNACSKGIDNGRDCNNGEWGDERGNIRYCKEMLGGGVTGKETQQEEEEKTVGGHEGKI